MTPPRIATPIGLPNAPEWYDVYACISELSREATPMEACGFVVIDSDRRPVLIESRNVLDITNGAKPDTESVRRAMMAPSAWFWHSHATGPAEFSALDRRGSDRLGMPYLLYAVEDDDWAFYDPEPWREFLGLSYIWGEQDCYGLVRMVYDFLFGCELKDIERPDEETFPQRDLFADHAESLGFQLVSEAPVDRRSLQHGDVVSLKLMSAIPNHIGIVMRDRLLHHQIGRLSEVDDLTGAILRRVSHVYRHRILS